MGTSAEWGLYAIHANPTTVTTGASSATVAIPNADDGNKARYVRICALAAAWVLPVVGSGSTITAGSAILVNTNDVVLNVRGYTHIAYIQQTSATSVNICPMEV